ncbi:MULTISPECIES: helix-turn-helix transcriptional regulator [unclassified Paenibacillus]|uniref:helix-turn-helix domain-containing protein n=1 Tax=unclassified Paenibacillus TaxID=185978 RepID=UPI00020D6C21|nr:MULTISPECIES: helix-turn-helix transcriptional regulator [unclassified Paenibacillus]EGL15307.1 DNA-binding helix-turn-helix protein [Paenibacillus sp. HGF7]EPD80491.1 hypothetical protein HMPREF1207_05664 [Paenibacillus sp. HGH0039]
METNDFGIVIYGSTLSMLRKQAKLTFKTLSEKINISASYLNKLEKNRVKNPGIKIANQLAEFYQVPLSAISNIEVPLSINSNSNLDNSEDSLKRVDLIKELFMAEILLFKGKEIPTDKFVRAQMEMALEMGFAYVLSQQEERQSFDKEH